VDTVFDEAQLRIGRRLAVKILNATRFVLGFPEPVSAGQRVNEPLDLAMLARLDDVIRRCTDAFEDYDHASALEGAEQFFWHFCDDYLELVKPRAYAGAEDPEAAASAITALRCGLSVLLRLFAPILSFVTEEAWSWWQEGSIHRAPWPQPGELGPTPVEPASAGLDVATAAVGAIRKAKSGAKLPQKARVARLAATGPQADLDVLSSVLADVVAAGHVADVELRATDTADMRFEVIF
jgi:valyl-tRNA synthetase